MKDSQHKKVWKLKKSHLYSHLAFTGRRGRGLCRVRAQAIKSSGKWLMRLSVVAEVDKDHKGTTCSAINIDMPLRYEAMTQST